MYPYTVGLRVGVCMMVEGIGSVQERMYFPGPPAVVNANINMLYLSIYKK